MKRPWTLIALLFFLTCVSAIGGPGGPEGAAGQELEAVQLPPPVMEGGMLLMQALKARRSSRSFLEQDLPL